MWKLCKLLKIISWIAVILWMALIFKLSSQPAVQSGKLSGEVANINIKAIEKVKPNTKVNISVFNHMVRKNAHFFIYFALSILTMCALRISGVRGYRSVAMALLICIFYASSDELHQIFVPGRGAMVKDIFLDSAGAFAGIMAYLGLSRMKKKVVNNNNRKVELKV